jgi:hypothetical protein
MKQTLFTLLLCTLTALLPCQTKVLTSGQVKEDVDIFITALKEAHPGLHLYLEPQVLDNLFADLSSIGATGEKELRAFYRSLLKVVVAIGDGHTGLYENKLFQKAYPYDENELPFDVVIIDGGAYVSSWCGGTPAIPIHAELLSINGKPVAASLQEMFSLTSADGNRAPFKAAYTEKIFSRRYAKLFGTATTYEVKVKTPAGKEEMYTIAGVHDTLLQNKRTEAIPLSFSLHPEADYAVLTVNTFQYRVMRKAGLDYHEFLKASFKELKKRKIENLIIDLRENYGGDNILAVALHSYLSSGSFTAMAPSLTKLNGLLPTSPHSSFPKGNYPFLRTHKVTPLANGYFELRDGIDSQKDYDSNFIYSGPANKPANIGKNKFAGKVYCLTSPLSFSAAANFATLLQRDNRAIFIGEETGGAKGAYCGGGFYTVTLPNSQIRLQIPFMQRSVSGLDKNEIGRGVIPDYSVKRTIEDVRAGYDRCFERVLGLIGQ